MTQNTPFLHATLLAAALLCISPSQAESPAPTPAAAPTSAPTSAPAPGTIPSPVEAQAKDILNRMSSYLQTLQTFRVHAESSTDEFMVDTGQRVQNLGTRDILVRRPDAFRIDRDDDDGHVQLYFHDSQLSLYSPELGYYATAKVAPTIEETLGELNRRYGIEVPLADLFEWSKKGIPTDVLQAATYIGTSKINGVECDHLVLAQNDLDWQIWIENTKQPLPRRMVIVTRDAKRSQYIVNLTWELEPASSEKDFVFSVPDGAQRIRLVNISEKNS